MNFFKNKFTKFGKRNLHVHGFSDPAKGFKILAKAKKEAIFFTGLLCLAPFWISYWKQDKNAKLMVIYDEEHLPSYLKIRAKPYGWTCFNCNLLDFACQKACKAENAKKKELYQAYLEKQKHAAATKL